MAEHHDSNVDEARYARNLGLFGIEGQRRLQRLAVGVVGIGGLGSHIVQQLAYLGTRNFALVDPDVVEISNLNRLIGANLEDVGRRKVNVGMRIIQEVVPDAVVKVQMEPVQSASVQEILMGMDCIFGCVDNDVARLHLTEMASVHRIPYFDLASDSGHGDGLTWYGGRVFVSIDGEQCLSCAGELDQRALSLASMNPTQRDADDRIYGVSRQALDISGPMVVSINGVVASLAVTEFVAWAAQLRGPRPHLVYRGDLGTVSVRRDERSQSCYYCDRLWRGAT